MKRALRSVRRLLLVAVIAALAMGMNVFAADVFDYDAEATSVELKNNDPSVSGNCTVTWYLQVQDEYRYDLYDEDEDIDYKDELYITVIPDDDNITASEELHYTVPLKKGNKKKHDYRGKLEFKDLNGDGKVYGVNGTYYISGYSLGKHKVTGMAAGTYPKLEQEVTGLEYIPLNTTLSQNSISFRGEYSGNLRAKRFEAVEVDLPLSVNDSGIRRLEMTWQDKDGEITYCRTRESWEITETDSGYQVKAYFAEPATYILKNLKVTDNCNYTKEFDIVSSPELVVDYYGEKDMEGYYHENGYRWKVDDQMQTLFITGSGEWRGSEDTYCSWNRRPAWCDYSSAKTIKHAKVEISNIEDLSRFFAGMEDLEDVDFTGSDLSSVNDLSELFRDCENLTTITWPTTGFNNVWAAYECFYNCDSLKKGVFPTCTLAGDVNGMFGDCDSLEEVDLSNCTVEESSSLDNNGVYFDSFMGDCPKLTKFKVPFIVNMATSNWGKLGVEGIWIESESGELHHSLYEAIVGSNKETKRLSGPYAGTEVSEDADRYPYSQFARYEDWAITSQGELLLFGDGVPKENPGWLRYADKIKKATVYSENLYSTHQMFSGCTKLESVDFSHVGNTNDLTTMAFMFEECIALKSVDLSRFDTGRVWNMQSMFEGCNSLTSIDLSKISTARVFNTSYMFARCIGLKQIDCSGFNLWNLSNGTYMFDECANLTTIKAPYNQQQDIALPLVDGTEWKCGGKAAAKIAGYQNASLTYERVNAQPQTPAVTEGSEQKDTKTKATYEVTSTKAGEESVVYEASTDTKAKNVTVPDEVTLADGKTYKVTEISDSAFKGNKTVTQITIGKNIETIGANAFSGCNSLTKVSLKGNTLKKVDNGAFKGCKKLKSANLGKSVETVGKDAFNGCKALKSVSLGAKIKSIGKNAFKGCSKMKTLTLKATNTKKLKITKGAFNGLNPKCVVKVPKKQLTLYKKLLKKAGLSKKIKVKKI
ncbi:MAG: leucine-rich repeat protein [Lachnospiraceae bacterium]|nr:leucine-rich repeat protein [Lachnospiraceae bacterium]